jgi:hypothetical protein
MNPMRQRPTGPWIPALCASLLAFVFTTQGLSGCAEDHGAPPTAPWDLRSGNTVQLATDESVRQEPRSAERSYGLPREGQRSIRDLINLLPQTSVTLDRPNLFTSAEDNRNTELCQGGAAAVLRELPMEIEAVVTLHPQQYMKVRVCGQDERFYGSFVVEDDTGGITVLRDARVAPYTVGDRVRISVRSVILTFGRDPQTRAILAADITPLTAGGGTILYTDQEGPIRPQDVGFTRRVQGVVLQRPTQTNFNSMIIGDRGVPPAASDATAAPVCIERCVGACERTCSARGDLLCRQQLCPAVCIASGNTFNDGARALLPSVCWEVGVGTEIGRRGFSPPEGSPIEVVGPIASSFGDKIWMQRLGQARVLSNLP